jgi:GTP-binding protein
MFVDEAEILVKAGDGGNGAVTFRREAGVPRGGPSGGDGGDGGDVILRARPGLDTLVDLRGHHHWYAPNGGPGLSKNMAGADGEDLVIDVPPGTLIYDTTLGLLIKDLSHPGAQVVVARGGRGGRGNARFATATNQTPRVAEPGRPGEQRRLRLELKLIADVGLVGLPNAGKSTLLARLSAARPKIADYPFTTLHPSLGVVTAGQERRFLLADLPGLIEGAHHGVGLGDEFLRHVERTRILVHLVELSPHGHQTPADAYRTIRGELAAYSAPLAAKPEIVALTKADLAPGDEAPRRDLQKAIGKPVIAISSATGTGLVALIKAILDKLDELAQEEAAKARAAPAVAPAGRPGDPRPAQALATAPAAPAPAPPRRTRKARAGGTKAGKRAPAKRKPRKAKAKKPPRAKRGKKTRGAR